MKIDVKWMRYSSALSSAVMVQALLLLGGFKLGSWLDARLHTYPFLMVIFLTLGAGLGMWWLIYCAEKFKPR